MIVEYLRYTVESERQNQFIKDYSDAAKPLLESTYCNSYEFCRCVEDGSKFIVRIEWTSADDHLKKFRKSEEFKRFLVFIKPYINDIEEMRHYELLDQRS